jgi:aldose 1-epimerase
MPAGRVPVGERPGWDFARARPLPIGWINNGFAGWTGTARVYWPEHGLQLTVTATPTLGTCIVYSPSEDAPFFCLEPVSHPVDAFHLPGMPGLQLLRPGERFEVACTFTAEATG